ncbi:acyl carrier protein [Nocardia asteroides]
MAKLWSELLGRPDLADESDSFELGGDSLLITRLVRKVNEEFDIRVPVRTMLSRRTLGQQTALISELRTARLRISASSKSTDPRRSSHVRGVSGPCSRTR